MTLFGGASKSSVLRWRFGWTMTMPTSALRLAVLSLAACAMLAAALAVVDAARAQESRSPSTTPYGVIEVGSKGVKAYVFDLDKAETDPTCSQQDDSYIRCLNPQVLPTANVNAISEASVGRTTQAVKDFHDQLSGPHHVAPERIFVVGSSGLETVEHKDTLRAAIRTALNRRSEGTMDFITVDQEASYAFEGILGMLPSRWRRIRESQAAVIDIGSGNLKASYLTSQAGQRKIVTLGMNYGSKRTTDEITDLRGGLGFPQAADRWRSAVLVPDLRRKLDDNPGFSNRNRIYLVGGIVWAMVNLTHPEDTSKFPAIRQGAIDQFLTKVSSADASSVCSDDRRMKFGQIKAACDTFTINNLIAGTEILKGLSEELGVEARRKNLFFFRDSLYAWPLGYLRNKIYGTENP